MPSCQGLAPVALLWATFVRSLLVFLSLRRSFPHSHNERKRNCRLLLNFIQLSVKIKPEPKIILFQPPKIIIMPMSPKILFGFCAPIIYRYLGLWTRLQMCERIIQNDINHCSYIHSVLYFDPIR